jgi:nitroreductase
MAMTPDELLTTTRSVHLRLDLDRPVGLDVVMACLRLAVQAPTGADHEGWRWVVVRDPALRAVVADAYARGLAAVGAEVAAALAQDPTKRRLLEGSRHLVEHLHRVPVLVLACQEGRPEGMGAAELASWYGSILPPVWSLQLALRSRGLGSCLTCAHLRHADEVAAALGIPENYTQVALLPVAYTLGTDFRPARRRPVEEVVHLDRWS